MKTIERTVFELCDEIDYLKEEVIHWKTKYEEMVKEQAIESRERLDEAQKGVANALMFALSVRDDEQGNLVISNEDRKQLAKNWK